MESLFAILLALQKSLFHFLRLILEICHVHLVVFVKLQFLLLKGPDLPLQLTWEFVLDLLHFAIVHGFDVHDANFQLPHLGGELCHSLG